MELDVDSKLALYQAQAQDTAQKIAILRSSLTELEAIYERQRGIVQFLLDLKTQQGKGNTQKGDISKDSPGA